MKPSRSWRFFGLLTLVAVLPFVVWFLTYSWTLFNERPEHYGMQILLILTVGGALLAMPYWMLKLGSRAAHMRDPKERELKLKDIPKDQEQLSESR